MQIQWFTMSRVSGWTCLFLCYNQWGGPNWTFFCNTTTGHWEKKPTSSFNLPMQHWLGLVVHVAHVGPSNCAASPEPRRTAMRSVCFPFVVRWVSTEIFGPGRVALCCCGCNYLGGVPEHCCFLSCLRDFVYFLYTFFFFCSVSINKSFSIDSALKCFWEAVSHQPSVFYCRSYFWRHVPAAAAVFIWCILWICAAHCVV